MKFVVGRMSFAPIAQRNLFFRNDPRSPIEIAEAILQDAVRYIPRSKRDVGFLLGDFLIHNQTLIAAKLGILRDVTLRGYDERTKTFLETENNSFETLNFLWDREQQAILLERRTAVYRRPENLFRHLQEHLNAGLLEYGLTVSIRALPEPEGFREALQQFDSVFSARFELQMPNLFGHTQKSLRDYLISINRETNANLVITEVANPSGGLQIDPDSNNVVDAVGWVDKGGGEWQIRGLRNNRRATIRSTKTAKTVETELTLDNYEADEVIKIIGDLRPEYYVDPKTTSGD